MFVYNFIYQSLKHGLYIWILKYRIIFIILSSTLFLGCFNDNFRDQKQAIPYQNDNLKSGDVVLRLGNGYFSSIFKNYASKEKKYSHIGIISIEDNVAYVYHSEAREFTGVGRVKRESLAAFLNDIVVFDFFRLNKESASNINVVAQNYYITKTPFDLDFNTYDDSELYCAELVANAINSGNKSPLIRPTIMLGRKKLYALDAYI